MSDFISSFSITGVNLADKDGLEDLYATLIPYFRKQGIKVARIVSSNVMSEDALTATETVVRFDKSENIFLGESDISDIVELCSVDCIDSRSRVVTSNHKQKVVKDVKDSDSNKSVVQCYYKFNIMDNKILKAALVYRDYDKIGRRYHFTLLKGSMISTSEKASLPAHISDKRGDWFHSKLIRFDGLVLEDLDMGDTDTLGQVACLVRGANSVNAIKLPISEGKREHEVLLATLDKKISDSNKEV